MEPSGCLSLGAHWTAPTAQADRTGIVEKSKLQAEITIGFATRRTRVASVWYPVSTGCVHVGTAGCGGRGSLLGHDAPAARQFVPVSCRRINRPLTLVCGCSCNMMLPHICLPCLPTCRCHRSESQCHIDYRRNLICLFQTQSSTDS
ncbi:hypothetical protein LX36DRAFT_414113 [Colletotrichum falcatum]|nr:hypothetical protein LX36DRAFT_414113 [Colletotrichum falcatum]